MNRLTSIDADAFYNYLDDVKKISFELMHWYSENVEEVRCISNIEWFEIDCDGDICLTGYENCREPDQLSFVVKREWLSFSQTDRDSYAKGYHAEKQRIADLDDENDKRLCDIVDKEHEQSERELLQRLKDKYENE